MLEITCHVVICGWVRRGLPLPKTLSQLPPCDVVRYLTVDEDRVDDERFTSSTLYAILCITEFTSIAASLPSNQLNIRHEVGD